MIRRARLILFFAISSVFLFSKLAKANDLALTCAGILSFKSDKEYKNEVTLDIEIQNGRASIKTMVGGGAGVSTGAATITATRILIDTQEKLIENQEVLSKTFWIDRTSGELLSSYVFRLFGNLSSQTIQAKCSPKQVKRLF